MQFSLLKQLLKKRKTFYISRVRAENSSTGNKENENNKLETTNH